MKYLLALGLVGMAHAQCSQHNGNKEECCNHSECGYHGTSNDCTDDTSFITSLDNECTSSSTCNTDDFGIGSIHVKQSGTCNFKARYYKVIEVNGDTRQIAYCKDLTKDSSTKQEICETEVTDLSDCDVGAPYERHLENGSGTTLDWELTDLCDKEASANGGGPGGPGGPSCSKTVTAHFNSGNGQNYIVSIDGDPSLNDPTITLCEGDTLKITRPDVFTDHPMLIENIDRGSDFNQNTGEILSVDVGEYQYRCTVDGHGNMKGTIKVLSSSYPQCACGHEPISDPGRPCDASTCPTGFTKRSTLPETLGSFPVKECCRPLKKGCMTLGKANYDSTAEVAGPCFDAYKSAQDKVNDFVGKTTFRGKRNVHKQHAKEDFYKKRAEGKTKKMAIREARAIMEEAYLSEKVKKRARGIVKIAVAINYGVDSCELGASDDNCASLDLADDRTADETTILTTEDADGSWAVVVDGDNIIVKQTRKLDGTFDMQCWDGSWGTATNYDVSNDTIVKTHKCQNRVFLLGSTQLACDENTCPEECGNDGLCPSVSTEADSTAGVSSSNGTNCDAIKGSGNATAFIEGQCCNNC